MNTLTKALIMLIGLSVVTTLLAVQAPARLSWVAFMVLFLSGLKARIILNSYLGLGASQFWRRGFTGFIGLFLVIVFGLYLLGTAP